MTLAEILAKLTDLSTKVDTLIAQGAGSITPAQGAEIGAAIDAIAAKVTTATTTP